MLLSALVRLLGFEDCACETAVLKDCEQYDVQRKQPLPLQKKKGKKVRKVYRILSSLAYKFNH